MKMLRTPKDWNEELLSRTHTCRPECIFRWVWVYGMSVCGRSDKGQKQNCKARVEPVWWRWHFWGTAASTGWWGSSSWPVSLRLGCPRGRVGGQKPITNRNQVTNLMQIPHRQWVTPGQSEDKREQLSADPVCVVCLSCSNLGRFDPSKWASLRWSTRPPWVWRQHWLSWRPTAPPPQLVKATLVVPIPPGQ